MYWRSCSRNVSSIGCLTMRATAKVRHRYSFMQGGFNANVDVRNSDGCVVAESWPIR
jgi:hypothetical protein